MGEKITLPTATATDNVAKNLTVSVEIKRGVDVVATGEYTPEEVGIYSVVYTVSDESGNTQTLTFEVLVSAGDNTDHNWTGQTPESDSVGGGTSAGNSGAQTDGCGASIGGGITAISTLLAAAVLMKKKNKKQTEKGDK